MSSSIRNLHDLHDLLCFLLEHPVRAEHPRQKKAVHCIYPLPLKVPDVALEDDIRLCTPGKRVLLQVVVFCVRLSCLRGETPLSICIHILCPCLVTSMPTFAFLSPKPWNSSPARQEAPFGLLIDRLWRDHRNLHQWRLRALSSF